MKDKHEFINLIITKEKDMDLLLLFLLQLVHETNVKSRIDKKVQNLMKKKHSE